MEQIRLPAAELTNVFGQPMDENRLGRRGPALSAGQGLRAQDR